MRPRTIVSASLLAAALALPLASPSLANILITIDKSTQEMAVSVDGALRYNWPVSTGRAGYDTPNGTFKVNRMDADHQSQEWDNAPMPHSMFFDMKGHAIHGFFDVKHLGSAVSHGCVRLAPANAAKLFSLVTTEGMSATTVVISGRAPSGAAPAVARRPAPAPAEVADSPMQISPGYGQREPGYGYGGYAQPYYGRPSYGQPYYAQPYYGQQPVYQPQYRGPFTPY